LIQISREQANWLKEKGYITCINGKYPDLIEVKRTIYVSPDKFEKLKFMK
jgi:hypothetical protein